MSELSLGPFSDTLSARLYPFVSRVKKTRPAPLKRFNSQTFPAAFRFRSLAAGLCSPVSCLCLGTGTTLAPGGDPGSRPTDRLLRAARGGLGFRNAFSE